MAAPHGGDELAERRRAPRIAPREVVEQRDPVGIGADGDDVADRLVDDGVRHRLGVVQPVPRVDADADGEAVVRAGIGEHDAVARSVARPAHQRADDGAAADLVVVAVDRRGLGGDVAVAEQGEQGAPSRRPHGACPACGPAPAAWRSSAAAAGRRGGTRSSRSSTTSPPWRTTRRPSPVNVPRSASSTPWRSQRSCSASRCAGGTATTIRSWASDSQISHGASPGYLSGTTFSSTSAPTPSAISPTADDSPPAPQSVIALHRSSAASLSTSISSFSVTGSPICTLAPATSPVVASIVGAGERGPADAVAAGAPAEHDDPVARVRARSAAGGRRRSRCSRRTRAGSS